MQQKVTPFLWFDTQAEEAANFYTSIFKDSEVMNVDRCTEGGPLPAGTVMTVTFKIFGQEFVGLNGGPQFSFNPAVSFLIACETQDEIDDLWEKLSADGGEEQMCGWVQGKYGLSWQVVPPLLNEMLSDSDHERAQRVAEAMLKMKKIEIADLKRAYEGN